MNAHLSRPLQMHPLPNVGLSTAGGGGVGGGVCGCGNTIVTGAGFHVRTAQCHPARML